MHNFREICYGNMKQGMLFRSEMLHKLSKKNQKLLKEKVKVVVDLRMPEEALREPDNIMPGIEYMSLPVLSLSELQAEAKASETKEFYRLFVSEKRHDFWTKLFRILLEKDAILFHCTSGKDRTGTVTALILSTLGIDKELIFEDYLKTNENIYIPFKWKMRMLTMKKGQRESFLENFVVKKEWLETAFDCINESGGMKQFLKEVCSLSDEDIRKLKEKYLK